MRKTAVIAACSAAVLGVAACGGSDSSSDTVKIGAVLDLSDGWTSLGKESQAALKLAEQNYAEKSGDTAKKLDIRIEDAAGDPKKAAELVGKLADDGYKLILGPGGSGEAEAALPVANEKGAVLISPGSTSSALAKANDSLLRYVPDDRIEAKAIVALMDKQGVDTLVPVWRTDLGNQGLHDSVTAEWTKLRGADAVAKGVSYPDTQTDGFDKVAGQVSDAVEAASNDGRTAVYLAAFGEGSKVITAMKGAGTDVNWYGGDGVVGDTGYTEDAKTAEATQGLCLPAPQYGLDQATKSTWQPILTDLAKANGGQSDAFGVVAYDAATTLINVGAGSGSGKSGTDLVQAVVDYANATTGASGPLALNPSGDRKTGAYDFWQVTGQPTAAKWAVTGGWTPTGGDLGTVVKSADCKF